MDEAALLLSRGDTLIIDYLIPQDAKTALGRPLGAPILLKSFAARRTLAEGDLPTAEESAAIPSQETIDQALAQADRIEKARAKRAARKRAKEE